MELVKGLLEKYPPTHEEVQEILDNADTGSSTPETIRNLAIDIGSGAALGAALERTIPKGMGDVGAVQPTSLPSLSEILSEFSPTFKTKAEKLEDIKHWYNNGFTNDEIDKLIVNTDFKSNRQVTKLWKLMNDQFKD